MVAAVRWPGGAPCAAVLSFDEDAESGALWRDPENARRRVTLSIGQYGPQAGTPEILRLLGERGLPATFFIPGWVVEHYPRTVEAVLVANHEIGAHGYLHERTDTLSPEQEEAVLARSVEVIERATGQRPRGYRSPAWELTNASLPLLHRYGFRYSSNMMDDYRPYLHPAPDGGPARLVELPVQWLLDDHPFFAFQASGRPMHHPQAVHDIWLAEFEGIARRGGLFMLTMHPMHIGRPSRIDMLAHFVDTVTKRFHPWWARAEDVAAFVAEHADAFARPA